MKKRQREHTRVRIPHAFSLVEILIVVALLGIMAAVAIPNFSNMQDMGRGETMSSTVRTVRSMVESKHSLGGVPLAASGYPNTIEGSWFPNGSMPNHTWTGRPMILQIVAGAANNRFPATKTFDTGDPVAANVWYNKTNGAFAALIPAQVSDAETLAVFNTVNNCHLTALNQQAEPVN